jgi:ketosteroid isomerase-like protein
MSEQNLALFRRALDAYNRRDLDEVLELAHPEVVWHPAFEALLGGKATVFRGHEGMREIFAAVDEAFSEIRAEADEIRDLGRDRVAASGRLRARGRASGAEIDSETSWLIEFRDGRVLTVWTFLDPDEAFRVGARNSNPAQG